jgi:hypothetical protein
MLRRGGRPLHLNKGRAGCVPQRRTKGQRRVCGEASGLNKKTLKAVMNNHGFEGPGKPSELAVEIEYSGLQDRGYKGLALKPPGEFLGEMY